MLLWSVSCRDDQICLWPGTHAAPHSRLCESFWFLRNQPSFGPSWSPWVELHPYDTSSPTLQVQTHSSASWQPDNQRWPCYISGSCPSIPFQTYLPASLMLWWRTTPVPHWWRRTWHHRKCRWCLPSGSSRVWSVGSAWASTACLGIATTMRHNPTPRLQKCLQSR